MSDGHIPWAEQDGDGMWEPSCYTCGVLSGPPFNVVLQRYNTEDEAFAAANSVLSMLPHPDDHPSATPALRSQWTPLSRREFVLMESQRAFLRRLKNDSTALIMAGVLAVAMALIVIDKAIGWSVASLCVMGFVLLLPVAGVSFRMLATSRMKEVNRQ